VLPPVLIHPPPRLPDRHPRHHSADAALIRQTADLLARLDWPAPSPGRPVHHHEAFSDGETRVLRYLQTNLSAREIASELYISVNTVKTHQRHLYRKLGAHSRTQAVRQARALGLLAPSA
jgi:LuxR family maltose regulon positive regulatory protein